MMSGPSAETAPVSLQDETVSAGCPGCGGSNQTEFFRTQQPVDVGHLMATRQEAIDAVAGDIALVYCHHCGLIYNRLFDATKIRFEPGYEVALHHSAIFREFIQSVVDRLIRRFDLRDKDVLEIGCGDGYFLRTLCRSGSNRGVGIDPTVAREGSETLEAGRVRFIRDFFTAQHARLPFDFVCCLSVFEDIPRPLQFLTMLRRQIADRRVGVYFEVFNGYRAIEQDECWSIHYEQCNYFSLEAFRELFCRAGFEVADAGPCYQGDQYLFVEAFTGPSQVTSDHGPLAAERLPQSLRCFGETYQQRVALWRQRLAQFAQQGERAVLWGSGGKGITFLNSIGAGHEIACVVDINPDRQGKFIPGTGQPTVSPNSLVQLRPDVVILTNRLYEPEIRQQMSQLGLDCRILHA